MTQLFEFHEVKDPEHLFGEGKCPLTYYVPFTLITFWVTMVSFMLLLYFNQ
jgi:hypothetical protein